MSSWQGVSESFEEGHLAVSHGGCIEGACLGGTIQLPGKTARPRGHGDPLSLCVIHSILRCQLDLLHMKGIRGKKSRDALTIDNDWLGILAIAAEGEWHRSNSFNGLPSALHSGERLLFDQCHSWKGSLSIDSILNRLLSAFPRHGRLWNL